MSEELKALAEGMGCKELIILGVKKDGGELVVRHTDVTPITAIGLLLFAGHWFVHSTDVKGVR